MSSSSPIANMDITLLTSTGSAIPLADHCLPTTGSASLSPASSFELLPPGGVVDSTFDIGCKATFLPGIYSLSIVSYVHEVSIVRSRSQRFSQIR